VDALGKIFRKLIERAAGSYVAGAELSDAIDFARVVERDGMSSTIAYWNSRGEDPANVYTAYLSAIDGAANAGTRTYISIKAPALSMSGTFTDALATRCRDRGIGLHFDSLALEHQAQTFGLIERLVPVGVTLGCTLPGRFAQSLNDAERAVTHRLRVRVVKGQWEDPHHSIDPRLGFMAVIDRLAGRAAHVSVATHEPRLAEEALATLAARGTPAELELLLGLPVRGASEVARRLNVPVRIYIPYGYAWLPYALSAARENVSVLRWILKDVVRGRTLRARRQL
jgi:proline dehydrogenase